MCVRSQALLEALQRLGHHLGVTGDCAVRSPTDVRRQYNVLVSQKRMIGGDGWTFVDVQGCPGYFAVLKGLKECCGVYCLRCGGIDQVRVGTHQMESSPIDETRRVRAGGQMDADEVGAAEHGV